MGKGRDKRKKHEDPTKSLQRAERQAAKINKGEKKREEKAADGAPVLNGEEDIEATVTRFKKLEEKKRSVVEAELSEPPGPRLNCVFTAHPTRENEVFLFGGELWDGESTHVYNDLLVYNGARSQWRRINAPLTPSPRSSAQGFTYKHYLYVHGGEMVSRSQAQFHHYRDTWRFDTNTYVWDEIAGRKGMAVPSARSGHRIVMWRRNAVLFGGFYDNALESRYYDDLWVLSDLDGVGTWEPIMFPVHAEKPHPRSGHCMGVHDDSLFVFGGYSTEKLNRFHKTESTVHRDLWTMKLGTPTPLWQKIKLQGIPPPIRSGMGCVMKDKKLFLFGGVVDIDAPGGRSMSSFFNDIFVLHMDSKKFFPVVLRGASKAAKALAAPAGAGGSAAGDDDEGEPPGGDALRQELERLGVAGDDDDFDDDDGAPHVAAPAPPAIVDTAPAAAGGGAAAAAAAVAASEAEPKMSHVEMAHGLVMPCRRMNAHLAMSGNNLLLFGGQYEVGKKEVALRDLYVLNVNRLDTFQCLVQHDLSGYTWLGQESDNSDASWESGSTVLDTDILARHEDEEEEDEEEEESGHRGRVGESDDDDEAPLLEAASEAPAAVAATSEAADGRTVVRGKKGMQNHKAQLEAQLSSASTVPTPQGAESLREFFTRTEAFWVESARESMDPTAGVVPDQRTLRRAAFDFCKVRYDEAIDLIEQLHRVNEQEKAEAVWLREHLAAKHAAAAAEAAAAAAEDDDDDGPRPAPLPRVDPKDVRSALKRLVPAAPKDDDDDD